MKKDKGIEKKEKEAAGVHEESGRQRSTGSSRKTTGEMQDDDSDGHETEAAGVHEESGRRETMEHSKKATGEEGDDDTDTQGTDVDDTGAVNVETHSEGEAATAHAGTGDEMTPEAAEEETESLIDRREGAATRKRGMGKGKASKKSGAGTKSKRSATAKATPKRKQSR